MRVAIVSDVHANCFALQAVLADISSQAADLILCAGDIFGYYPWAGETYQLLKPLGIKAVLGNHDRLVLETLGLITEDQHKPRPVYYDAARMNGNELTLEAREWLHRLPDCLETKAGPWHLKMVHGTPDNALEGRFYPDDQMLPAWLPGEDEILILGHTHYPIVRRLESGGWLLNPGSVGQPRDGCPESAWILMEWTEARGLQIDLRRVAYDQFQAMNRLQMMAWPEKFIRALNKTKPGSLA